VEQMQLLKHQMAWSTPHHDIMVQRIALIPKLRAVNTHKNQ